MAPAAKRPPATPAEVVLVHLKSCLVNLPASLVAVLSNANTPAQNIIVELSYRSSGQPQAADHGRQRSAFMGWTGMPSKRRTAPLVGREGLVDRRLGQSRREPDQAALEIDATFARQLGLSEGHRVGILLHLDPPLAHTVNIEPVTPDDWEIIELHATFLELNLLSQIRALPNPAYSASEDRKHNLTLHLSPTSTANIAVTALTPAPPATSPFARIAPDAEVIVAPKTRARPAYGNGRDSSRSVASLGKRSSGGRSRGSVARHRSHREEEARRAPLLLRAFDRGIGGAWFSDEDDGGDEGFVVWVDADLLASRKLRGVEWVLVSIVTPLGLQEAVDGQAPNAEKGRDDAARAEEAVAPASRVVARIAAWTEAPDDRHAALSSPLCASLGASSMVGSIIRIEMASPPVSKSSVTALRVYPFAGSDERANDGLRFGGESKAERELVLAELRRVYGSRSEGGQALFNGPLTDGVVLSAPEDVGLDNWHGGILRLHPPPAAADGSEKTKGPPAWVSGLTDKVSIEIQPAIARPNQSTASLGPGDGLPRRAPVLVGIDKVVDQVSSHIAHLSSVLITGGLGSGKTSLAQLVAHRSQVESLCYVTYFPCRKLVTDETRVSSVKAILQQLFMTAAWCARLGGRSLVILDDLDRLCPTETELQVGGENGRSRQISELVSSTVRQYCGRTPEVVLLATAQSKEALNQVIVGGHVVRDFVALKAPNKDGRRRILEEVIHGSGGGEKAKDGRHALDAAWMEGSSGDGRTESSEGDDGFVTDEKLELLDIAGRTDGYMPADLELLVSRARNEALVRSVEVAGDSSIELGPADFDRALAGFTPASLRKVTLQHSTTTFDSIGGLKETRKILLETLQYPTTYAPIFAQCPLRLRSGLLLYGYPGCGKTMLASAVAGECGLNFISVKGPEILNKYIGASEKSVRDLFERAESARPCVLFFDEFDSIAPKRGHDSTGVTDRVVNQLLTQMDGAEGLSGVYVLAATSRPDLIDPALLRPGRLDKSLLCDLPSHEDRVDILRALSKRLKMSAEVLQDLSGLARRTDGYSGADLQALAYNAQLEAIHEVLGEQDRSNTARRHEKTRPGSKEAGRPRFLSFRLGEEEDETGGERSGHGQAQRASERAAISTKLEAIREAGRRRRRSQRPDLEAADEALDEQQDQGRAAEESEVVIRPRHLMASLATTRPSISADERRRLAGFYRDFVVGRNGEMPNGQGPTEVGARSSLM